MYLKKLSKKFDKPALVVELKCNKDADAAIKQIKDRKYGECLKDYTGKILLIGINYDRDDISFFQYFIISY